MPNSKLLKFDGLEPGVSLNVDSKFEAALTAVFSGWPFALVEYTDEETFADIQLKEKRYIISSPFMDKPLSYKDEVNCLCMLVVELAWAQLRARPELLCLHGAAVQMNGRLVVFPSTRRAGKSTFSLGLLAQGLQVFTDDFLPLNINDEGILCGLAQGISPRLRLPVPAQIGALAQTYLDSTNFVENKQYRYVAPKQGDAAKFGDSAPLGALVFLERRVGEPPELAKMGKSEALTGLIKQNFSRAMNAPTILNMLSEISQNAPAFTLKYDTLEPAIELLKTNFSAWDNPIVPLSAQDYKPAPEAINVSRIKNWRTTPLTRAENFSELEIEGKRYLTGQNGRNILFLNETAAMVWHLLQDPVLLSEVVEVFTSAFPEQDQEVITKDLAKTMKAFVRNQLVVPAQVSGLEEELEVGFAHG